MNWFKTACFGLLFGSIAIKVKAQQKEETKPAKQLEEVKITAQKITEDPQQVPAGVSVLSAKKVEEFRLQDIKQLTGIIPNLYSASPGDARNVVSIRGIATTSYDQTVATYIDGVNQFGLDTYIAQLFDVERIEVLRGPQGTLYGRNAMGGVINIITRQPGNTANGFAGIEAGNYGAQRYSFGLRVPLINNKLFLGAAARYSRSNGYYTNLFNNTHFDKQNALTGNYYLRYLPGADWSITLNAKHTENANNGPFPLAADPTTALAQPYLLTQNAITHMADNLFNASLSAVHKGYYANFSSQSTYQSNRRTYQQPIDGDYSQVDAISVINDYGGNWNKVHVFTQEFRLTSAEDGISKLKWVSGLYGYYQDNPVKQGIHFGADAALVGSPISNFTNISTNGGQQAGFAAYGQATYALSAKLDLTIGIRYDHEHEKQSIKGEFQPDGGQAIVTQADTASSASYHAFSPKAGLAYHLTSNNLLYGTYSRGFRTGGISQLGSDSSQPPLFAYQPEYSNNFEVGLKNIFFDKRLRVNMAAFYTMVSNAQVPTLILPDAITITRNVGRLNSKGFEWEIEAIPFKGFEAGNSFGYTHARYTNLLLPQNGNNVNAVGNRPVFSPDITSMTFMQYTHPVSEGQNINITPRLEWLYIGDQFFDLANQVQQRPYHLFDGSLAVSVKKLNITGWIRNVGNKKYIDYAYDLGASHLGAPSTYGLSVTQRF